MATGIKRQQDKGVAVETGTDAGQTRVAVEADEVIQILARQIAQLTVANAQLQAAVSGQARAAAEQAVTRVTANE